VNSHAEAPARKLNGLCENAVRQPRTRIDGLLWSASIRAAANTKFRGLAKLKETKLKRALTAAGTLVLRKPVAPYRCEHALKKANAPSKALLSGGGFLGRTRMMVACLSCCTGLRRDGAFPTPDFFARSRLATLDGRMLLPQVEEDLARARSFSLQNAVTAPRRCVERSGRLSSTQASLELFHRSLLKNVIWRRFGREMIALLVRCPS